MLRPDEQKEYLRLRGKGWAAKNALATARVNVLFELAEREGLVRFEAVDDTDTPDVSYFDTWTDLPASEREKLKKEELERIEREGAYGIQSFARFGCGELHPVDSCWGFVGEDWRDSGYDADVKLAALLSLGGRVRACPDKKPELEARLRALGWENEL